MSDCLLWADFETTGLKFRIEDSVLEVAWTVTDLQLNQLTEIRQRFVKWAPPSLVARHTPLPGTPGWEDVNEVVHALHGTSGLTDEWTKAIYSEPNDVGQTIADDLTEAHVSGDDKIHLAGAGVSHFDQELLGLHVPEFARHDDGGRLHYRTFDVSVGAMVAGPGYSVGTSGLINLLAEPGVRRQRDSVTVMRGECPAVASGNLDLYAVREHRAADDVAVALAYARALRVWVAS